MTEHADTDAPKDQGTPATDFSAAIASLAQTPDKTARDIASNELSPSGTGQLGDLYRRLSRAELDTTASETVWSATLDLAAHLWNETHRPQSIQLVETIEAVVPVPDIFASRVDASKRLGADMQTIARCESMLEEGDVSSALALSASVSDRDYAHTLEQRARRHKKTRRGALWAAGIGAVAIGALAAWGIHQAGGILSNPPVPTFTENDRDQLGDVLDRATAPFEAPGASDETSNGTDARDTPTGAPQNETAMPAEPETPVDDDASLDGEDPPRAATAPVREPSESQADDATPALRSQSPAREPAAGSEAPTDPEPSPEDIQARAERVYTCALGRKTAMDAIEIIDARETPSPDAEARIRALIGQVNAACDVIDISPGDLTAVIDMIPDSQTAPIVERLTATGGEDSQTTP